MLKKLVALTLVALMVINPMTAFAVSWGDVKLQLDAKKAYHNAEEDVHVVEIDNGNTLEISGSGVIEDFDKYGEYSKYVFKGTITLGGKSFEVYVGDVPVRNEDGTEKKDDAGNTVMQAQQVVVNVESGVAITAEEVSFGVSGTSELTVNTSGRVGLAEDTETGSLVVVTEEVFANVEDSAKLTFNNDGAIEVTDSINFNVDENGAGSITVTNGTVDENGVVNTEASMTTGVNVGVYMWGDGTISFTNNGQITTDTNKTDVEENEENEENSEEVKERIGMIGIGVWGGGDTTVVNGATGVVNGDVTGWLEDTEAGASNTVINQGEVTGDVGVWGQSGEGSITLDNQGGTVGGNLGTFTREDTSTKVSNSGTVEGEMFADNGGTQDMTVTNSGDTNGLSVGNANAENVTVINSGNVTGGETHIDGGAGNVTFENTGSIEGERFDLHAHTNGTVTGTNSGSINVEWGYVGSSENGNVSFTNESDGSIHTDENFDIVAGNWNGEEDYEYNPENSSTTSFVNKGEIVTESSFAGNLQENGSITLENTETGTMTAVNNGIHIGINDNGHGSVSVNNAGTVNSEWFNVNSQTTGTASITNTGTVNGYMGAYADGAYDDNGNLIEANKDGVVSVTNHGTVTDGMGSYVNGGGTGNVVNTGDVTNGVFGGAEGEGSINVNNSGTAGDIWVDISGEATGMMTNTGDASFGGGHARDDANITINNEGTLGGMDVFANGAADMTVTNNGDVTGFVGVGTAGEASGSFENNGFVDDLYTYADEKGQMDSTNNGEIAFKYTGFAYGDGQVTINNSETGVIGDSEQDREVPDGLWGQAEGGNVTVNNEGTVNGEIGGVAYEGTETTINNNGSADTAWINAHGGDIALNNEGTISGTLSVSIGTQSNDVTDTKTVAALLEQTGINISGYENVDIYTANPNGELIARYSVAADGTVVLEEVLMEQGGGDGDDPRFWTKERIRHDMEEKRKAAAIGGVYGSPYWLKQLYLGYMSLNLRLFNGDEQLLFKENISWVPGANVAGEKILTLNVKLEDTANLAMRLDGAVIDKLEQADIVTINIVDGAGNLFMEYKVEDLKGAREMYGLTAKEYIVVGSADADVMKIAEDGTISPIEGETEAEPVEEVAEEAKAETEAEAAEETPAA